MAGREIVVVGASAGGIDALQALVETLRSDFSGSVFVVLHVPADSPSMLPTILGKTSNLPVEFAQDKAKIDRGHIYVAPPDRHLLLERGRTRVVRGPKENRARPAIDPLFRSAAWSYGPSVVGVVLSGYLDDGAAGLWAVKQCGGITVVQAPSDAMVPDMPENALTAMDVDYSLPAKQIGPLLVKLSKEPLRNGQKQPPEGMKREIEFAMMEGDNGNMDELGHLTAFTCPSCRGPLWELRDGETVRYRCYTGHAFSPESLLAEQSDAMEDALYSAIRALEEKAQLSRRLAEDFARKFPKLEARYLAKAHQLEMQILTLRKLIAGEKEEAGEGNDG